MRTGAVVSTVIAIAASAGLMAVFVNSASPYVTIGQLSDRGQNVHVVGKIVPASLRQNIMARQVNFQLKDESGEMAVRYVGPPQSNLASATQVVVIGSMKDDVFEADQMLIKCPSKYEGEEKAKG